MALYKTGNPVPSSAMPDVWDNNRVQDEILNSEELEVETRTGIMTPTWKGVLKKNEDEIEETRQNLIPLSRQYMTLAAAQADIANIPVNSTTYVRSQDGSALADEYINNGGTLQPTGRKMPSGAAVELMSDTVQRLLTALHVAAEGAGSGTGTDTSEAVQNLMTGFHALAETVSNLSSNSSETTHLLAGFDCLVESMTKLVNADQQTKTSVSGLLSSVQICTEMLNTLAAEIVTPDGASQYGYAAFSVPGTVSASNGSFGTNTSYRRTGMVPVRKGDVVRLTVYTASATAGHAA
ncbi:hypothetical protein L1Q33_09145, partial [Klebsiella pneumoniae]